jgi:hypothetical protein
MPVSSKMKKVYFVELATSFIRGMPAGVTLDMNPPTMRGVHRRAGSRQGMRASKASHSL